MPTAVILGTAHPHVFGLATSATKVEGMKLAGVFDEDADARQDAAGKYGIDEYATVDEALAAKPDLVLIGAVPCDRAPLTVAALNAGAAVLVDKPLAVTEDALASVKQACEQSGKPVIVYYPYRGHPGVVAAKRALETGRIGPLVRVFACGPHKLNAPNRPDWHWTAEHNGGIFIDIGSHHVDLCCWFAGDNPDWLSAIASNHTHPQHKGFQDFGQAQLHFPNGVIGHVEVDWLNPTSMKSFGDTRLWIQGTNGKIELRMGDEPSARIWNDEVAGEELDTSEVPTSGEWDEALMQNLVAGNPVDISQEDVWRVSRITIRAQASAAMNGQPITVLD